MNRKSDAGAAEFPAAMPACTQVAPLQNLQTPISCTQAGWGDDEAGAGPLNRRYHADAYANYSASTRQNLARLAEAAIDYELLEAIVLHIDEHHEEGAILVFLPGQWELLLDRKRVCEHMQVTGASGGSSNLVRTAGTQDAAYR